ncbi:hypothetical protein L917_20265 [Phytophthora nicotianae]|uniref:Uncharacterized protein n=1 Tax=Phytophthora nicotianae TaxID=4792 RepID=W2K1H7_PHYNI|nr:hypothetical protein L917_20265 [Phytophthora nicotianae]
MLPCIEVVLRSHARLKDAEFASWMVSSFLGPPPNMSLREACSTGCIRLLDWIWISSCTSVADRVPHWTLTNYLRSDRYYYHYQFTKSLEVAANRGDLEVVKWLVVHFSGCEAPASVVGAAVIKGHLSVVKYLWVHCRYISAECNKKRKVVDDKGQVLAEKRSEELIKHNAAGNRVCWGDRIVLLAAEHGHFEMVRWLCENTLGEEEKYYETYDKVMKHALRFGDDDLTKFLLPRGRCILDYAKKCPRLEVIELTLDCGYLRRDEEAAASAIRGLAAGGHLELMQQIALLHSPLREDYTHWGFNKLLYSWFMALVDSCKYGQLETVQWLHRYPICQRAIKLVKRRAHITIPMTEAAGEGHWNVVQYLCEQKTAKDYDEPLERAIRNGHLKCVEIIIRHFLNTRQRPRTCPIDVAAKAGRLEVVQFFHNFNPQYQFNSELSGSDAWWSQSRDSFCGAAASGNLELVKWLHASGYDNGAKDAMDAAARAGHFDCVKWLHLNRQEGCSPYAMWSAAMRGQLPMVQWFHFIRAEEWAIQDMDWVARRGHLDVIKWLDANKLWRCSDYSAKEIYRNGPLRVASWLYNHYPEQTPVNLNGVLNTRRVEIFEMLLFLDVHSPQCINRQFAEDTGKFVLEYSLEMADGNCHILSWLKVKLPSMELPNYHYYP